jgi:beta-N-acetylhexosaminidase
VTGQHLFLGVPGPELTPEDAALFRRIQPGGFILFTRNMVSAAQTRKLTDDLRDLCDLDPFIAVDQEGGRVTRTREFTPIPPSAAELRDHADTGATAQHGALTGDLLRLLGFNLNFAPVLDIAHDEKAENALRGRCYGRTSQQVIDHAGMFARWMAKRGVLATGKHFPSCARANVDPHHDLPVSHVTLAELLAEDILPFTALMPELAAVMTSHVLYPALDPEHPATLSRRILTGLLRDQLGFDHHLVITDDLDMGAIQRHYGRGPDVEMAIRAGNDIALICHQIHTADAAIEAVARVPQHLRDDSLRRIQRARKKIHHPLPFSENNWQQTTAAIAKLREDVAHSSAMADSPVEKY